MNVENVDDDQDNVVVADSAATDDDEEEDDVYSRSFFLLHLDELLPSAELSSPQDATLNPKP